jgi:hypothetical protein
MFRIDKVAVGLKIIVSPANMRNLIGQNPISGKFEIAPRESRGRKKRQSEKD